MKIEYLITTSEQYKHFDILVMEEEMEKAIYDIPGKDKFILTISRKSNDEVSARILSKFNNDVMSNYDLILLTNEFSEYFLNRLYPLIIELELKLRKLLKLVSSINTIENINDEKKILKRLEEESLSRLFEFLFTDIDFNNQIRGLFKNNEELKDYKVSKERYKKIIDEIDEKTPWNQLLGNRASSLRDNYISIYEVRNEIAHAHQIDSFKFDKYSSLLKKTISELNDTIHFFEISKEKDLQNYNFNLSKAMISYYEFVSLIDTSKLFNNLEVFGSFFESLNKQSLPAYEALAVFGKYVNTFVENLGINNITNNILNEPYYKNLAELSNKASEAIKMTLETQSINLNEVGNSEDESED